MSVVFVWILGAAALISAVKIIWPAVRNSASWVVRWDEATRIILYELVSNRGVSIKDQVSRAVELGEQNQRALENHLLDHHNAGRSYPEGTPDGF